MSGYISSNANRFYVALETAYGEAPAITAANRFPAVKMKTKQQYETAERRDKTGSRTFLGLPGGGRKRTGFEITTYMTSWSNSANDPCHGPLFQAGLGAAPRRFAGGIAAGGCTASTLVFAAPHGLMVNQAVAFRGEIRFVSSLVNASTVQLNAPLSVAPVSGNTIAAAISYLPATELASVSIFDYWSPASAVQRVVSGAAIDRVALRVNGDYHEFGFSGTAKDIEDAPAEPAPGAFDHAVIPGNMGQAWLGTDRFFTITEALFLIDNGVKLRANEFGSSVPKGISPGMRAVSAALQLYQLDDTATRALYTAARQRAPLSIMFQLGEQAGQLCGVYMKNVIPEAPEFDDGENRLQWKFHESRAQGAADDEMAVAFA